MSEASKRVSERLEGASPLELLRAYYHVPVLGFLMAFMFWIRAMFWERFVTADGTVLFTGNDAWYHYRSTQYTVQNWPFTMPFDPWTHFPVGTSTGQFGTLFDQLVATAALVVGLGSPTDTQVRMVLLFAPAVFGTLTAIPVYYFGKQIAGRAGALVGVLLLALSTGQFLSRSVVGFSDHHIAEAFFLALASAAFVYALSVARRDQPIWELFAEREWDALRPTLVWSALAGVAITLYLWTWPPGVFFVGILGIFYVIVVSFYQASGRSPEPMAITGVLVGLVVGVGTLVAVNSTEFRATGLTLLQPLLAFGLAAGAAFMAALARVWEETDHARWGYPAVVFGSVAGGLALFAVAPSVGLLEFLPPDLIRALVVVGTLFVAWYAYLGDETDHARWGYPGIIVGLGVVGLGLFFLLLPEQFDYISRQVMRVFGYDATAASRTVAEAKPLPLTSIVGSFFGNYGLAFFAAIGGFVLMLSKVVGGEKRPDYVFLLVLSVFLFLATMTQRRFDYYFVVPVAVLNAYLAAVVFRAVDLDQVGDSLDDLETYQVLTVVTIVLLVAAPLVVAGSAGSVASQQAQPGSVQIWQGSLNWMEENTPAEGHYGGASNDMEYYGTFERQEDFAYQEGQYGVMSWWDYGHWITTIGERIPDANPFQQGATKAANFLLASNETRANQYMTSEDGEETRYVMIDYQLGMADTRKFTAPTAFETEYDLAQAGPDGVTQTIYAVQDGQLQRAGTIHKPRSYESMRVRLYQANGGRMAPGDDGGPVFVVDWELRQPQGYSGVLPMVPGDGQPVKQFQNVSAAREYVERDGTSQVGGLPGQPSTEVPALKHYRLVHASRFADPSRQYPALKTFEKVPGASVEGSGPPNTTVTASVRMQIQTNGQTFRYTQQAQTGPDGSFTMTLPYSTTGYDEWGTEAGYTNVSVKAVGPYTFATPAERHEENLTLTRHQATANVTEGQVIGEDDSPVRVTLEHTVEDIPEGAQDGANGSNTSDGGGSDGNATGNTSDDSNASNATNGSSQSLAHPSHQPYARAH